jgi:hypothetical protein
MKKLQKGQMSFHYMKQLGTGGPEVYEQIPVLRHFARLCRVVGFFWFFMPVSATTYPLIPQQLTTHGFLDKAIIALFVGTKRLLRDCMSPECFGCTYKQVQS